MAKIEFSPKQEDYILSDFDVTLDLLEGTPRSGKTTANHFKLARFYNLSKDTNHLVTAYNQEQAFRLYIDGDGTGLMHIFNGVCKLKSDKFGDHLEIYTPNGMKRIYYKGGGKSNSVGAITGLSLGSVAFGEINLLNMEFIQEALRRTLAADIRWHCADENPPSPMHPVIKKVFEVQNTRFWHWTMKDNPALTEARIKEISDQYKKKSAYLYKRDVLGQRVMAEGVIYSAFDMDENIANVIVGRPMESFFVGDGGQGDATTMGYYLVTEHEGKHYLYKMATYYHSGRETGQVKAMSTYAKELKAFMQWCFEKWGWHYSSVYIDPACKSLREELHLIGIDTQGADNNAHDVKGAKKGIEVGIERLQSAMTDRLYKLFEHNEEKYDHYYDLQEIGLYVRDTNGKPTDADNHCLDCDRYANNHFYRNYILRGR